MLPKDIRLPASEIPTVARLGKRIQGSYLNTKFVAQKGLQGPLFAISVSKKLDNRATQRNRVKRRIRAFLIANKDGLLPGKYLIIANSPKAAEASADLEGDLARLLA